jgi:2EXR family
MIGLTKSTYFFTPIDADLKATYVLRPIVLPSEPSKEMIVWPKPGPKGYIQIRKFKYFHKLPFEVRCMIWKLKLDNFPARTILVKHYNLSDQQTDHPEWMGETLSRVEKPHVTADIPIYLHVESASRYAALKEYKLVFSEACDHPVYFNPSKDNLHLVDTNHINILLGQVHKYWHSIVEKGQDQKGYCKVCPEANQAVAKFLFEEVRNVSIDRLYSGVMLSKMNAVEKMVILRHPKNGAVELTGMWTYWNAAVARGDRAEKPRLQLVTNGVLDKMVKRPGLGYRSNTERMRHHVSVLEWLEYYRSC